MSDPTRLALTAEIATLRSQLLWADASILQLGQAVELLDRSVHQFEATHPATTSEQVHHLLQQIRTGHPGPPLRARPPSAPYPSRRRRRQGCARGWEGVVVTDQSVSSDSPSAFAHRVVDRLTAMKLRVGSLRRRLRLGVLSPEEIETHLAQIEHEIDATAALAHDVQAKEARLPVKRTEQVRGTVRREEVYVDEDATLIDDTEAGSSQRG